jgi:hypothetical protein
MKRLSFDGLFFYVAEPDPAQSWGVVSKRREVFVGTGYLT